MAGWQDVLNRFRAFGPPGPAAPAAVPADKRSRLVDELAPVFAGLRDARGEARQLRFDAAKAAASLRAEAARQAARLVADASAAVDTVRAAAYAAARTTTESEIAARLDAGRVEADRIGRAAAIRQPALVDQVTELARSVMTAPDPERQVRVP